MKVLNFLNSKIVQVQNAVLSEEQIKRKETELIEQIHNDFNTAEDRLLAEAKKILDIETPEGSLIEDKASRLKGLGFVNTEDVKYDEGFQEKKIQVLQRKEISKAEADLINYYKMKYPFQKFLTEIELDRICDKWGLIHAPVKNYIRTVPEKNLNDIENAKILNEVDTLEIETTLVVDNYWQGVPQEIKDIIGDGLKVPNGTRVAEFEFKSALKNAGYVGNYFNSATPYVYTNATLRIVDRSGLFIAAPLSHYNLEDLDKDGEYGYKQVTKIEIKDPIVFRYVKGGIQVLTMWGDDQFDPNKESALHNEILN